MAVITGASRGLGAGMAAHFAQAGLHLGLCARHRPDLVAKTRPRAHDGRIEAAEPPLAARVDVTDFGALAGFADAVVGRFGRIDLWVNNAGLVEPIGPLAEADPAQVASLVAVNVTGVLYGAMVFAAHVRSRPGGGVLVNISSGTAARPYSGWAAYGGSKSAVDHLTEVVALEEEAHGLRAYAVAPGVVDTDMQAAIRATDGSRFPEVERFRRLKAEGGFNSAPWVAEHLVGLAFGDQAAGRVRLRVPPEPHRARGPRLSGAPDRLGGRRRPVRAIPGGKVSGHGQDGLAQVHQAGGGGRRGRGHDGQHLVVRPQAPPPGEELDLERRLRRSVRGLTSPGADQGRQHLADRAAQDHVGQVVVGGGLAVDDDDGGPGPRRQGDQPRRRVHRRDSCPPPAGGRSAGPPARPVPGRLGPGTGRS